MNFDNRVWRRVEARSLEAMVKFGFLFFNVLLLGGVIKGFGVLSLLYSILLLVDFFLEEEEEEEMDERVNSTWRNGLDWN